MISVGKRILLAACGIVALVFGAARNGNAEERDISAALKVEVLYPFSPDPVGISLGANPLWTVGYVAVRSDNPAVQQEMEEIFGPDSPVDWESERFREAFGQDDDHSTVDFQCVDQGSDRWAAAVFASFTEDVSSAVDWTVTVTVSVDFWTVSDHYYGSASNNLVVGTDPSGLVVRFVQVVGWAIYPDALYTAKWGSWAEHQMQIEDNSAGAFDASSVTEHFASEWNILNKPLPRPSTWSKSKGTLFRGQFVDKVSYTTDPGDPDPKWSTGEELMEVYQQWHVNDDEYILNAHHLQVNYGALPYRDNSFWPG